MRSKAGNSVHSMFFREKRERVHRLTHTWPPRRTLNVCLACIDLFQCGNQEGRGFSSAVLRTCEDVAIHQDLWNGLLLNRRRSLKALFIDAHQQLSLQIVVFKRVSIRCGYILSHRCTFKATKALGMTSAYVEFHFLLFRIRTSVFGRKSGAGKFNFDFQSLSCLKKPTNKAGVSNRRDKRITKKLTNPVVSAIFSPR